MFERLITTEYWRRMVMASATRWHSKNVAKPVGSLLGWNVWAMDGKAYLFKGNKCRRADWFELMYAVRKWI